MLLIIPLTLAIVGNLCYYLMCHKLKESGMEAFYFYKYVKTVKNFVVLTRKLNNPKEKKVNYLVLLLFLLSITGMMVYSAIKFMKEG